MNANIHARRVVERRGLVWFALLGGGGAWTLHLLLAYVIAEFGCLSGLGEQRWGWLTIVSWLLFALSAASLALGAAATIVAGKLRSDGEHDEGTESVRTFAFSARLAWVTNLTFTFAIAVQSVPILWFLGRCR